MRTLVAASKLRFWRAETTRPEPQASVPRKMTGFFSSLSEDGKKRALTHEFEGTENHGSTEFALQR